MSWATVHQWLRLLNPRAFKRIASQEKGQRRPVTCVQKKRKVSFMRRLSWSGWAFPSFARSLTACTDLSHLTSDAVDGYWTVAMKDLGWDCLLSSKLAVSKYWEEPMRQVPWRHNQLIQRLHSVIIRCVFILYRYFISPFLLSEG